MTEVNDNEKPSCLQNEIERESKRHVPSQDPSLTNGNEKTVYLEEALNLTGLGRYNYALFAFSTYSLKSAVIEIFSVAILATAAQCDLSLDTYKKGLIGSVPMLGVMSSGLLWGFVADTKGRKYTLRITMGGAFFMATVSSLVNHWIFLAFTKFLSAVFASGTNAVMYTLLGESTPKSHRTKFLLYKSSGTTIVQLVMAAIAFPILKAAFSFNTGMGFEYRPWRLLTQVYGFMNGANALLLVLFFHESPKFYFTKNLQKEGIDILTKIFLANNGQTPENYPVNHVLFEEEVAINREQNIFKSMWTQSTSLLNKLHIKKTMLMFYLCSIVYSMGPSLVVWLPEIINSYSNNMYRVNDLLFCQIIQNINRSMANGSNELIAECNDRVEDASFYFMATCGLYLFVLTNLLALISKFVDKKWTFIGVHMVAALASLCLNSFTHVSSVVLFIILTSTSTCMGITTTYTIELYPTHLRAMAVCLTMMVGRTSSFIVINAIAPLMKFYCIQLFYGIGIFTLSGAALGWFLPSESKSKRREWVQESI